MAVVARIGAAAAAAKRLIDGDDAAAAEMAGGDDGGAICTIGFRSVLNHGLAAAVAAGADPTPLVTRVVDAAVALVRGGEGGDAAGAAASGVDPALPLLLLEDAFDAMPVARCDGAWDVVERHKDMLADVVNRNQRFRMPLLRLATSLTRRLSRTEDTVLLGRVLVTLAFMFPLTDRSGVNLQGHFSENATRFEGDGDATEAAITEALLPGKAAGSGAAPSTASSSSSSAAAGGDGDAPPAVATPWHLALPWMPVHTTVQTATAAAALAAAFSAVGHGVEVAAADPWMYRAFWRLQAFLAAPGRAVASVEAWAFFTSSVRVVLALFQLMETGGEATTRPSDAASIFGATASPSTLVTRLGYASRHLLPPSQLLAHGGAPSALIALAPGAGAVKAGVGGAAAAAVAGSGRSAGPASAAASKSGGGAGAMPESISRLLQPAPTTVTGTTASAASASSSATLAARAPRPMTREEGEEEPRSAGARDRASDGATAGVATRTSAPATSSAAAPAAAAPAPTTAAGKPVAVPPPLSAAALYHLLHPMGLTDDELAGNDASGRTAAGSGAVVGGTDHAVAATSASDDTFSAKFLTNPRLMPLQLADPSLRRHVLVQLLIVTQYLVHQRMEAEAFVAAEAERRKAMAAAAGAASSAAAATAAPPPRRPRETFAAGIAVYADLLPLQMLAYALLRGAAATGAGAGFARSVAVQVHRESVWRNWKARNAPDFERTPAPPAASSEVAEAGMKRRLPWGAPGGGRAAKRMRAMPKRPLDWASAGLHGRSLWDVCADPGRAPLHIAADYAESMRTAVDPANELEPEFWPSNNHVFVWRAYRMLASERLVAMGDVATLPFVGLICRTFDIARPTPAAPAAAAPTAEASAGAAAGGVAASPGDGEDHSHSAGGESGDGEGAAVGEVDEASSTPAGSGDGDGEDGDGAGAGDGNGLGAAAGESASADGSEESGELQASPAVDDGGGDGGDEL